MTAAAHSVAIELADLRNICGGVSNKLKHLCGCQ